MLAVSFIAIAIIPLAFLSYALWQSGWENAWREINEKHQLLAVNLASPLSIYVRDHQSSLGLVAHRISYSKGFDSAEDIRELLQDTIQHLSDYQALLFVTKQGVVMQQVGKRKITSKANTTLESEACFQRALNQRVSSISGVVASPSYGVPTVLLCEPVPGEKENLAGILIGELDIAPLETMRRQVNFGKKGHSAIVDQYGKVIVHPNREWMKQMKDLSSWTIVQNMLAGKHGVMEFYSPFIGENMVAGYAGDPNTGWGVMVPQPRSEVEAQVYALMRTHLYWGGFGLGCALFISLLLARWITHPLNQLANAAVALKRSGFKGNIPNSNRNAPREIQQLTSTIQDLSEGFKTSQQEITNLNRSLETKVQQATRDLQLLNTHLKRAASYDELTDLPNRRSLQMELDMTHDLACAENRVYSVLLCDLDRFKLINDNYGHHVGDEVLKIFAKKAPRELRQGDIIGRWGGEEFLCVLKNANPQDAFKTAERIRKMINEAIVLGDNLEVDISVSIGIATYPDCGKNLDLLLSNADAALYEAKRSGRNRVICCNGRDQGVFTIAGLIHDALTNHHVHAAYQKIVDLQSGETVAEETLARIVTPAGILEANQFIEAASQLQLTHRIDYELIQHTIQRMNKRSENDSNILQFVNVSTDLLRNPGLTTELVDAMEFWRESHQQEKVPIVIEITEREFLGRTRDALRLLGPFLDRGYLLAIDDFGSGYSSFQYLTDLPIAYLKIEGDLVNRALKEPKVRSVLTAIQDTAKDMNVVTLAECIENKAAYELLKELGINLGQGHYFGKPEINMAELNSQLNNVVRLKNLRS